MTDIDTAALLARLSEGAMLLEPREFFDKALVDVTDKPCDHWPRESKLTVAVYDQGKCIEALMAWLECDYDNALDYYGYNTAGAWLGEGTPMFRERGNPDDDGGYLKGVVPCEGCGQRWCTLCSQHWADCDCSGPDTIH